MWKGVAVRKTGVEGRVGRRVWKGVVKTNIKKIN